MDKKTADALLSLLKDPDKATFNAVTSSLTLDAHMIPVLEYLWEKEEDMMALSRLDLLIHQARFNTLKKNLTEWKAKGAIDVIEGAWLMTTYQQPDVTLTEVAELMDGLTKDIWLEIHEKQSPAEKIDKLNKILFSKHGLHGDIKNLHSLHNTCIDQVLRTKQGNDIILAIIYMGIAQKLCIPVYGVPLPRNFILAYLDEYDTGENILQQEVMFYINPFNGGAVFNDGEIKRFIQQQRIPYNPAYFQPCPNLVTIESLVNSLLALYEQKSMNTKADEMEILLQILKNDAVV